MPRGKKITIITYNGLDGACAAAMAFLRYPKADIFVSSARFIGRTLKLLDEGNCPPAEIFVCGLGVYCPWEEAAQHAVKLRKKHTAIQWYCGRA